MLVLAATTSREGLPSNVIMVGFFTPFHSTWHLKCTIITFPFIHFLVHFTVTMSISSYVWPMPYCPDSLCISYWRAFTTLQMSTLEMMVSLVVEALGCKSQTWPLVHMVNKQAGWCVCWWTGWPTPQAEQGFRLSGSHLMSSLKDVFYLLQMSSEGLTCTYLNEGNLWMGLELRMDRWLRMDWWSEMECEILLMSLAHGSGDEAVLMGCCTAIRNKAMLGAVLGKGTLPLGTEKYWLHRALLSWSDLTFPDLHITMEGNWMLL